MSLHLKRFPRLPAGLAVLFSFALIQGCGRLDASSTTLTPTSSTVSTQPPVQREAALRVVVKFHSSGGGREAALLTDLSRRAQAPVSYVSSVAPDTHVYLIGLTAGQRSDDLLTRLRATPGVAFVEIDTAAQSR